MSNDKRALFFSGLLVATTALAACEDKPKASLAPEASALAAPRKKSAGAAKLEIEQQSSKVSFTMDAPLEKITGEVNGATKGTLHVDVKDLSKSTAHLFVDISGIELFQRKRASNDDPYGEKKKVAMQNEHARNWLEIGPDVPAKIKARNIRAEFTLSLAKPDSRDLTILSGITRTIKGTVTGDFLLHGRSSKRSAQIEATFTMKGNEPQSVHIKTIKPFVVDLAEHDVRPRTAFDKFAAKTLEMMAPKVAKEAMVDIDLTAKLSGAVSAAPKKSTLPASTKK